MKQNKNLRKIIFAGLFAAMIFVLTFTIKIPTLKGYIHLGDSMIYLAASLVPTPYALLAAAFGGAFSDLAGGYMIYIIPTFIIKGLNSIPFSSKENKILTKRNALMVLVSGLITVVGYYITNVVMLTMAEASTFNAFMTQFFASKMWIAGAINIPENIIQAVGSGIVYIIIAAALDKIKIKDRLNKII